MRLLKQTMAVLGCLVVIAVVVALVAPKSAQAVVSTMVTVINPSSQPVFTLDADAHNSFVASDGCAFYKGSSQCVIPDLYTVPEGDIAVIDSVSAVCSLVSGTSPSNISVAFTSPAGVMVGVNLPVNPPVPATTLPSSDNYFQIYQNVKTYASGGTSGNPIQAYVNANGVQTSYETCDFTISGHLAPQ